jgi:signal transduction histidine kinase
VSTPEQRDNEVVFHGILLDITEKKRLEELMVQSEKMLSVGELAAGMAHEINNPLAGVLQSQQVIKKRLFGDLETSRRVAEECGTSIEAVREFLERRGIVKMMDAISEASGRAANIVSNMLGFVRKSESHLSPNDLDRLLDRAVELVENDYDLRQKYDFKAIKIVREYEENLPKARCEANKIVQVFLNILKNGAQAMGGAEKLSPPTEAPRFILGIASDRKMLKVEIEDNGPGMNEATRKRVFEPFFTTKATNVGTGLGLSVSYFIITEEHKGTMSLESHLGKGTKFVVRLPIAGDTEN